jgi:acetyltransferase-like isoleucine patch superfamily enzyme
MLEIPSNKYHPLVWIHGTPIIGKGVYIGGFSEINCKNSSLEIGDECDIASFVSINCADSHKLTLGIESAVSRKPIKIGNNSFIGSHSIVKGGAVIGHHCVVAAGTIVEAGNYPPYSLIFGNPVSVKSGYYLGKSS